MDPNTFSLNLYVGMGIVFIVVLLGIVIFLPGGQQKTKIKKQSTDPPQEQKDWAATSVRLEKHIYNLREEIAGLQKEIKNKDKELLAAKENLKKTQERIEKQSGWLQKEQQDIDKGHKELAHYKAELGKTEQRLEKEHAQRLSFEHELREAKSTIDSSTEIRRQLEGKIIQLEGQFAHFKKKSEELEEVNANLTQKHEETDWISKSEYVKVEKALKQKEQELEKFKAEIKHEGR